MPLISTNGLCYVSTVYLIVALQTLVDGLQLVTVLCWSEVELGEGKPKCLESI